MRQLLSSLGKLGFLAILLAVAAYLYFAYQQNRPDPAKLEALAREAAAAAAASGAPGSPAIPPPPPPRPKRSAVKLTDPLQAAVNHVAEAFVRDSFDRRAHVTFPPNAYRVQGNRDYRFFTVISSASGRDDQGRYLTLPWKARLFWKESFWYLYSLELNGQPRGSESRRKRGNDPAHFDRDLVEETEGATSSVEVAAPPVASLEDALKASEPAREAAPAAAAAPATPAEPVSQERTWTDITGKHTLVATLVTVRDGMAHFRSADGTEREVPLAKLSEADQQWIQAHPP